MAPAASWRPVAGVVAVLAVAGVPTLPWFFAAWPAKPARTALGRVSSRYRRSGAAAKRRGDSDFPTTPPVSTRRSRALLTAPAEAFRARATAVGLSSSRGRSRTFTATSR
jgi:hypothetical protein